LSIVRDRLLPEGLGNVVQAFAHRNYRIYAAGNAFSLIGVWMQRVAVGWLAWTLTHSGAWLGIMSMAEFFPVVFLSPLAGALADRRDRVGIIRVTQIAGSVEAILLAVLVHTDAITIELLFALTLLLGVFNAIAQPSRLALIPTLVDRPALPFWGRRSPASSSPRSASAPLLRSMLEPTWFFSSRWLIYAASRHCRSPRRRVS
jgi:MFS family permease